MLTEIIISGFGGQGVLFAGKCLAYGAMMKNIEISWLPSYGPEMRGGTANCSVCLSDKPIGSPLVTEPDILIAMNEPSVDRFIGSVKSGGILIYDSGMTDKEIVRQDITVFAVPAAKLADENNLGGMGNIVLLGKALRECAQKLFGIDEKTLSEAFAKLIPAKKAELAEKNASALRLGMAG
ncbi:MAG TPA: 2-oxoacid:ferredoxin oxidoreductase subunit gamma [Ruminococcaceae bacterium]|nr:2-oxoacid:ferredoxin oxidoreductase subunit gamma [Oscillospiraceae bacterium]